MTITRNVQIDIENNQIVFATMIDNRLPKFKSIA